MSRCNEKTYYFGTFFSFVIRCRVAGPNGVSTHEEGGTAERRNMGVSLVRSPTWI